MGFKINIPKEFKEEEDFFMEQLLRQVTSPNPSKLLRFYIPNSSQILDCYYGDVFTTEWDFTDSPKGW